MYVIVNYSDFLCYHSCDGIYTSFYEALGHIVCLMDDEIRYWIRDGYSLNNRTDFEHHSGGWEWSIEMIPPEGNNAPHKEPVHVTWNLFQADVDKEDGKTTASKPVRDEDLPF